MQPLNIPLSLYIHIPWCVRKCPYCDFNSHEARHKIPEDLYIAALLRDLHDQLSEMPKRPLVSIFFGGGTPSLFSPSAIEKILVGVQDALPFDSKIEITLEANPGTMDEKNFHGFYQAGINRLSIGIQSLQNEKLKTLGRIHNREHALRAIDIAIKAGFNNFNLDFMHGLPNQSIEDALADLRDALSFSPPHLSWYQLTIEQNTFFHHQPPVLPEDDILFEIQEQGKMEIFKKNLMQYEISAYAQSGHECIHNKNYWEFGDYLGIGAGAHSKVTDLDTHQIFRYSQLKNPMDYLMPEKKLKTTIIESSKADICFEFMLNALRLIKGVPAQLFTERTGLPINTLEPALRLAKEKKLLVNHSNQLRTTKLGQRFLNDVVSLFLPKTPLVSKNYAS
ncbi:MAG: hypothetical protein ACD_60C00120G0016 [uncultured bacterium]|nr:MAG: hypothetical protein ACD_60C00120G0016 [uncultured bacterium]